MAEEYRELAARERPAEIGSLRAVAVLTPQVGELLLGLDALRDHLEPQGMAHLNDRGDQSAVRPVVGAVANERPIDLQRVQRVALHQVQARVAGPEVVDRHANAEPAESAQMPQHPLAVVHDAALGQLELQAFGVVAGVVRNSAQLAEQPRVVEMAPRQIDRQLQRPHSGLARRVGHRRT